MKFHKLKMLTFDRLVFKEVVLPYLSTLPNTLYVHYWPEKPCLMMEDSEELTYLFMLTNEYTVDKVLNISYDEKG